jgi:hypothetical protein
VRWRCAEHVYSTTGRGRFLGAFILGVILLFRIVTGRDLDWTDKSGSTGAFLITLGTHHHG